MIVILGGTSGLGFSAARALVREGARLVLVGRNADKVRTAERELGAGALGLTGDAMQPGTAAEAIALAVQHHGGFHGLYHVAGGSGLRQGDGPLHELTDAGWAFTLNENRPGL